MVPTEVCRSSTTIQIRFRKNYFSDVNGVVCIFLILSLLILVKGIRLEHTNLELLVTTPYDVKVKGFCNRKSKVIYL